MAEAVGRILVELLPVLVKEAQLVLGFQSELEAMNENLKFMQPFVTDLEMRKRNDEKLKATLCKIRELIYDADDILTDCQIRIDQRKDSPPYHRISARTEMFKYRTTSKLKKMNSDFEKLNKNLNEYLNLIAQMNPQENNINRTARSTQNCNQDEIIGLEEDTEKIKKWIFNKNEFNRIGVVGLGGLGKTTIAWKIFKDSKVINHFDELIWVSVSPICSESDIMKKVLKRFDGNYETDLMEEIQNKLSNKMYLIVFDDVWLSSMKTRWWEGLPKKIGSSIIITTRNEEVAERMGVEERRILRPNGLNLDESWSLFSNVAFRVINDVHKNTQLEKVAREIVEKCGGLPLAIKTIGGLLSAKKLPFSEWKRISEDFRVEIAKEGRNGSETIMASLQLSYDELPTYLKSCLLCVSLYPEDCEINAEKLVRWWIGEGLIRTKDSRTASELGFDYLSDLIGRCLIEVVSYRRYDNKVYWCKVHDMVRDLTIQIAREDSFGSFDKNGVQIPNSNTRHLSVITPEMNLRALKSNSKLRAFLLMTSSPLEFNKNGLAAVNSLRVIDLSHSKLGNIIPVDDLLSWISRQKRLAYLNLNGVSNLKNLPKSFKKLWNLQILVLTECNDLQKLPQFILTLHKLSILDIQNCPSLQYFPNGLAKLSNLEFLSGFKLGCPATASNSDIEGCRLGELEGLIHLRVLKIEISENGEIAEKELQVLSKLEQLKVLSINAQKCKNKEIIQKLDKLSPPLHLQELYLKDYHGETTPKWISPVELPELQYLCIEEGNLINMNKSFWENEGEWKIKSLSFKLLPKLVLKWEMVQKAMPLLEYLEVCRCFRFESFPCVVDKIGSWRKE